MMETNHTNSNVLSPHTTQISFQCGAPEDTGSGNIRDPECVKRKGAPKKLRKKSPLETISSKVKASTGSTKRKKTKVPRSDMGMVSVPILQSPQQLHMPLPFSYTNLLLGGNQNLQFTHHLQSTCLNPSLATTPTLNMQGLGMHFDGGNTDAPTEEP
ncbi:uncharacterized protein LOC111402613 [Olea europaea var. sylvestris]|uniref:uncharacterized protein LOC111402613 n=1 Tax=Olea europaea var. sylvestris TaxID=158386 RepID=UPI000C1D2DE0|nr:uncharacterized protein LOC111402613 [Olea europaea var. sylvestris]